ncbi:hypothetical protein PIB30_003053 [Stylosanthes scabra]|uniref:Uncharacterized protein n=1 Tax=Stylosanthes scabra TaxID=79078 RepID=A0ABU6X3B7_9FABA|nr:hypothetical protein [Stylosanthes scabra]
MMVALMAAQAASVSSQKEEYDLNKAFDLGFGTPVPQQQPPEEFYDLDDFPEKPESFVTPSGPPPFNGDFHLEVMRKHFRSMRPKKEIDLAMITAYSLVLNKAPIPRFQSLVYILPPSALSTVLDRYVTNFVDIETKKVYSVDSLQSDEHLKLVDNSKLINYRYGNLINQLLERAGFISLLAKATKKKPAQISWHPKYIQIHKQPNS